MCGEAGIEWKIEVMLEPLRLESDVCVNDVEAGKHCLEPGRFIKKK